MTLPAPKLRIDTSGTAFGAAPTWADYTSSLRLAGSGKPVGISWGRQPEQNEAQPRQCSFLLDNTSGAWTPGNAAAPAGWRRNAPVNIQVTVGGVTYDRFTGYVDSILPTWPGGVQSWSVVEVSCTDLTSRLANAQPLRSLVEEEMLADGPTYLYPLDEVAGSTSAGDISGNGNRAAYRSDGKYGAGVIEFGSDLGLSESTSGVAFSSDDTAGLQPGKLSVLALSQNDGGPVAPAAGAFTLECWVVLPDTRPDAASFRSEFILKHSGGPFSDGRTHGVWLTWSYDGSIHFSTIDGANNAAGVSPPLPAGAHHIVGTVASDLMTVKLYVDGALVGTGVGPGPVDLSGLTRNHIGGNFSTTSSQIGSQFQGTVGLVALYPTVLPGARILAHYQAGVGALTESSDARYSRLAGYAGVTVTGLPAGRATVGHQNTKGVTVTDALETVARTEGTVSYVTGAGTLTFQVRDLRYDPTDTLALTSDDIDGDVQFRHDGQGFANEYTATRQGGAAQRVLDTASQTTYGRADGGSLDVISSTDYDARQIAAWLVALHKDPFTVRTPNVTIDLLSQPTTAIVQDVLAATISTKLTVSGLPIQAPASSVSLFIEGGTESIGPQDWSVTFNTAPPLPFPTLRADATASARTKLDSGLKIPL